MLRLSKMEIEPLKPTRELHAVTTALPKVAQFSQPIGALGNLEVRLAKNQRELMQVLAMREEVFELPSSINVDRFDAVCDHLLVMDKSQVDNTGSSKIVGTYRLIRKDHANMVGGFYSAQEFELESMLEKNSHLNFLEFGRSCVLPKYRGKRTLELLWAGSWSYVKKHKIDILFGCASFQGCDPNKHREALSFLHHFAPANAEFNVSAKSKFKGEFDLIPKEEIDPKKVIKHLPPLIKGYLRVGAKFGTQIAVDNAFGTIDVLTVLPVENIDSRYIAYYGENAQKHAC